MKPEHSWKILYVSKDYILSLFVKQKLQKEVHTQPTETLEIHCS